MEDYVSVDLGKKRDYPVEVEMEVEEAEVFYPELYMNADFPKLPDGEFIIKAKVCKANQSYDTDGKSKGCSLYVKKIFVPVPEKEEEMDSVAMLEKSMEEYEG